VSDAAVWHDVECASYTADLDLWRELAEDAGGAVLDVGCGTGRVALDLAERGHEVMGVDSDPELVATLARRARERGLRVHAEVSDARTLAPVWSKPYPKESPRVWVSPRQETLALVWDVTEDAAKEEIKADPKLAAQLAAMKEKEGDYFVEITDAKDGSRKGSLLIETGKGSFRLKNVYAAGDRVVVTDNLNRVLVYSLATGEQKGRAFGNYPVVSDALSLMCVENERGKIAVYDLPTMEKRDELVFSNPVSMLRFSGDGRRLLVLTSNQTVYVIDAAALSGARAASN